MKDENKTGTGTILKKALQQKEEQGIKHLNRVLTALYRISRIIHREDKPEKLIRNVCKALVSTRSYCNAWIVLLDEHGKISAWAEETADKRAFSIGKQLEQGRLPSCVKKTLDRKGLLLIPDPGTFCKGCILSEKYNDKTGMVIPLADQDKAYGVLCISLPGEFSRVKKEIALFSEIGNNVASALNRIEIEMGQKIVKEQLMESEKKYERLFRVFGQGIWAIDKNGLTMFVNPSLAEMLGYSEKEMVGKYLFEFMDKEGVRNCKEYLKHRQSGIQEQYEFRFIKKDGSRIDTLLDTSPIIDRNGKYNGAIAGVINITERKSAEKKLKEFYSIINTTPVIVFLWKNAPHWPVEYVTDNVRDMFGYTAEEFLSGKVSYDEIIHPDDLPRVAEEVSKYSRKKIRQKFFHIPYRIITKKKEVRWVDDRTYIRRDKKGDITHYQGVVIDITERKRAESEIEKLSLAVKQSPSMIIIINNQRKIEYVNPKFTRITGYKPDEITGCDVEMFSTNSMNKKNEMRNMLKSGREWRGELCNRKKNGQIYWESASISSIKNEKGQITSYIKVSEDITEKKKTEAGEKQRISDIEFLSNTSMEFNQISRKKDIYRFIGEKIRSITEKAIVAVSSFDEQSGKINIQVLLGINKTIMHKVNRIIGDRLIGFSMKLSDDIIKRFRGHKLIEVPGGISGLDTKVPKIILRKIEKLLNLEKIYTKSFYWEGKIFGNVLLCLPKGKKIENKSTIETFITQASLTLRRKQAELALEEEKERLSVTLHSIGDGVIATDAGGKIILLNPTAVSLTGWPIKLATGKDITNVFSLKNKSTEVPVKFPFKKIIETGKVMGMKKDTVLVSRHKSEKYISCSVAPIQDWKKNIIGMILVFRDISLIRKMEENMLNFQKTESLNLLAGGIAHDFNNLLSSILGNISLAKSMISRKDDFFDILNDAEMASLQARGLTRQLLTFSKATVPVKRTVEPDKLVRESVSFSLHGTNIREQFHITQDIRMVSVDESQIQQVINNIVINSVHAMPGGGKIDIVMENIDLEQENPWNLDHGSYVKISIVDQGIGIPEQNLKMIFDPYFTTKQKGSGLGLATSYSIIKKHKGAIEVESKQGKGTAFHIYLPALKKGEGRIGSLKKGPLKIDARILVMDDEEMVRRTAVKILRYLGCRTEVAKDGVEAFDLYKKAMETGVPFDAVIMDLTVKGGMGGKETSRMILKTDPKARIICSSGYSGDDVLASYSRFGFTGRVSKPYTMEELGSVLVTILNQRIKGVKQ
ncbi:MAG: PAS domain S-box protein [Spirochaetes bacterium]|nr:PAS domain S-box protein [Spirochaetota bacterium]